MKLSTKISLILIALGLLFWFLGVQLDQSHKFWSQDSFSYEIDGKPHDLGDESRICDILRKKHGEVRISILVTPNVLRNYQNVFQTSDFNDGIRLELDEIGSTGVVVAGETPDHFLAAASTSRLSVGKQSTIALVIGHDSGVTISIDGNVSAVVGVVKPICNRLRIGVGFDDTRSFDGTGSITIVTGSIKLPSSISKSAKAFGEILVILGSIMWIFGDLFTQIIKSWSEAQPYDI